MKREFNRLISMLLCVALVAVLMPSVTSTASAASDIVAYAVEGGNIYFDKSTSTITDCDESVTSAEIPPKIEGVAVTCIGENAFFMCSRLTNVTIPDSVTSIEERGFANCLRLTSVTIPDNVTNIGEDAFVYCSHLTSVNVSAENKNYMSVDGVLFNKDKTMLLRYPAGKTDESYAIPDGVTSFDGRPFIWCSSLQNITIPDSVESIGNRTFSDCTSLTNINVSDENKNYSSVDGVLFDKDKTKLIAYPGGKTGTYTIPNGVTSIGSSAFSHCDNLTSVTIPSSVTSIWWQAFLECTKLTSVTIGNGMTTISGGAFFDCESLKDIYYSGSEDEWKRITIEEYDNEPLLNATIHYNSTGPSSGLVKLATPTDLAWDSQEPGSITCKISQPAQGKYLVKIYRENETEPVEYSTFHYSSLGILRLFLFQVQSDELDSGNYYFTIQSKGDGVDYSDSDIATSAVWTYTKPSAKLPAFDSLSFQWPEAVFGFTSAQSYCGGFEVKWYVSATPDGDKELVGWRTYYTCPLNEKQFKEEIYEKAIQFGGEGYYFFRARPLSNDITLIQNGPWSDYSEPYYFSGLDIAQQLNEIVEGGGTDEDIRAAVQNLNRDALRDAMLADPDNTGAVAAMAELEEGLATTFAVESTLDTFSKSDVTVVGALLNPVTSSQVVLNIGKPQVEHVLPTLYNQSLAVQFSMELNGVQDTDDLAVPVVMTLPVPDSINPNFLVILHYPAGGGAAERIDSSQYYLYQQGGRWFVRFVLDHFSDFAMTQELTEDYKVVIEDYTKGAATVSDLVSGGQYSGQTSFTVSCADACVVAYSTDGGTTYTKLDATASTGGYTFTVDVTQATTIAIVKKGDINLDGRLNTTDVTQLKRHITGNRPFTSLELLAGDVNDDGKINTTDVTQTKRSIAGSRTLEW